MKVSEAVAKRSSVRSFLNKSISTELIKDLLTKSSRAASGVNLQPLKIFVINDSAMYDFLEFQKSWTEPEVPAYDIYPQKLKEPYRTSRFELGEQMYEILVI
jgi:nitroreductase